MPDVDRNASVASPVSSVTKSCPGSADDCGSERSQGARHAMACPNSGLVYSPLSATASDGDGDRNMMSNIHPRGTPPEQAGCRLAVLAGAMLDQRTSGVALDLTRLKDDVGEAARGGYREPQKRVRLVECSR